MKFKEKKCRHRHREINKFYRKNYPFGKNSTIRFYDYPKKCIEFCKDCGLILDKWTINK